MKIVQLSTENVKRLKVVEITPDGNTVIIGGDNAQGKSSVLDSILMALAGKKAQGLNPVRNGEEKAKIVVDLGEYIVTRTITKEGGGAIKVKTKDGASYGSPQKMLDELTSKLTFDPLVFTTEKPGKQVELLKHLVGLDFSDKDAERANLFEDRRNVKRDAQAYENQYEAFGDLSDVPDELEIIDDIIGEGEAIRKHNDEGTARIAAMDKHKTEIESILTKIATLKDSLTLKEIALDGLEKQHEGWKPKDQGDIRQRIAEAQAINLKVAAKKNRAGVEDNMLNAKAEADHLTEKIEAIDKYKQTAMAEADFPVPGLAFDDNGVTFNGIPFAQCSSAESLRVSVAMGIALNPKLKVLLIRDGSLLDDNSLAMIAEAAKEADAQVWIERVSKGDECSVIIEDGEVAQESN